MHTPTLSRSLSIVAALLLAGAVQQAAAQNPGSGGPAPSTPTTPTEVPIDGGATLLLAGSVAYGVRKLRQRHK